ncbi:MAG: hypothetical protein DRJ57_06555 [Thermoprotei archaeon]|nr:MAG: hypothetical protein DRJ57_06555 [Thermoprotei archaeon]
MQSLEELKMGVRVAREVLREIRSSSESLMPVSLLLSIANTRGEEVEELLNQEDPQLKERIAKLSRIALSYE